MVNQEIFGGLKLSLSKGISLKDAMMSFYNSGYEKQEIEQAARALQQQNIQTAKPVAVAQKVSNYGKSVEQKPKVKQPVKKIQDKKEQKSIKAKSEKSVQKVSSYEQKKPENLSKTNTENNTNKKKDSPKEKPVIKNQQKVSNYDAQQSKDPRGKFIIFTLIFVLFLLCGVLAGIFIFKDKVMEFLRIFFQNA